MRIKSLHKESAAWRTKFDMNAVSAAVATSDTKCRKLATRQQSSVPSAHVAEAEGEDSWLVTLWFGDA